MPPGYLGLLLKVRNEHAPALIARVERLEGLLMEVLRIDPFCDMISAVYSSEDEMDCADNLRSEIKNVLGMSDDDFEALRGTTG